MKNLYYKQGTGTNRSSQNMPREISAIRIGHLKTALENTDYIQQEIKRA